ncbi:MAG: efflux RND transporter periplasmic adaptor subunit [Zavarzinella sp.]
MYKIAFMWCVTSVVCVMLAGCQKKKPPMQAPPPPAVTVVAPQLLQVFDYGYYTGHLEAAERVEIRARVKGKIKEILVPEGKVVQVNTPLYVIEPEEYQAVVNEAKAGLERAKAELKRSEVELERATNNRIRADRLHATNTISDEEYVQVKAAEKVASASVELAVATVNEQKAKVDTATLNLGYAVIKAPITGRISRTYVTEGNLVGYSDPTLLTIMVTNDPIYVYFDVPESDAIRYSEKMISQGLPAPSDNKIPIDVGVTTEKEYPHDGKINFREPKFEPGTGTVRYRGQLDNPNGKLSSGMYARVRVKWGGGSKKLCVPAQSVLSDIQGNYVLVVNAENKVVRKAVDRGVQLGAYYAIEKGLEATDRVIMIGMQKSRPGGEVKPQQGKPPELPETDPMGSKKDPPTPKAE